jgi:hypothetical protein
VNAHGKEEHTLYSCFASLTLTMCKAGDIFAKYETRFGASSSSVSWAKIHLANSCVQATPCKSTEITQRDLQIAEAGGELRERRRQSAITAGFQATKVSSSLSLH